MQLPDNAPAPARRQRDLRESFVPGDRLRALSDQVTTRVPETIDQTIKRTGKPKAWERARGFNKAEFVEKWGTREQIVARRTAIDVKFAASKTPGHSLVETELTIDDLYEDGNDFRKLKIYTLLDEIEALPGGDAQNTEVRTRMTQITQLQDEISARQLFTSTIGVYTDMMEIYKKLKDPKRQPPIRFDAEREGKTIEHLAHFNAHVDSRLRLAVELDQILNQIDAAGPSPAPALLAQGEAKRAEIRRCEEYLDDLLNCGADTAASVPGRNTRGVLPVQELLKKAFEAENSSIVRGYQTVRDAAARREIGGQRSNDQNVIWDDREGTWRALSGRSREVVNLGAEFVDKSGRINLLRMRMQGMQQLSRPGVPGGAPIAPARPEASTLDERIKIQAQVASAQVREQVRTVLEQVALDPRTDNSGTAFVEDLDRRINAMQHVGTATEFVEMFGKKDKRGNEVIYDALEWPRNSSGNPIPYRDLPAAEKTKIDAKRKTYTDALTEFRRPAKNAQQGDTPAEQMLTTIDLVDELRTNPQWDAKTLSTQAEPPDLDRIPSPPPRVTKLNMEALATQFGDKRLVILIAYQQMFEDWDEHMQRCRTFNQTMHDILGIHYKVSAGEEEAFLRQQQVDQIFEHAETIMLVLGVLYVRNAKFRARVNRPFKFAGRQVGRAARAGWERSRFGRMGGIPPAEQARLARINAETRPANIRADRFTGDAANRVRMDRMAANGTATENARTSIRAATEEYKAARTAHNSAPADAPNKADLKAKMDAAKVKLDGAATEFKAATAADRALRVQLTQDMLGKTLSAQQQSAIWRANIAPDVNSQMRILTEGRPPLFNRAEAESILRAKICRDAVTPVVAVEGKIAAAVARLPAAEQKLISNLLRNPGGLGALSNTNFSALQRAFARMPAADAQLLLQEVKAAHSKAFEARLSVYRELDVARAEARAAQGTPRAAAAEAKLARATTAAQNAELAVGRAAQYESTLGRAAGTTLKEESRFLRGVHGAGNVAIPLATIALQGYLTWQAYGDWRKAEAAANEQKDSMAADLRKMGFVEQNDGSYRHEKMGISINLRALGKGMDAESNKKLKEFLVAGSSLAITVLIAAAPLSMGATLIIAAGLVIIEITLSAIFEYQKFLEETKMIAEAPAWFWLAFGTARANNKTPRQNLRNLELKPENMQESAAQKLVFVMWVEELQRTAPHLYAEIFGDKINPALQQKFYDQEFTRVIYPNWKRCLFMRMEGRAPNLGQGQTVGNFASFGMLDKADDQKMSEMVKNYTFCGFSTQEGAHANKINQAIVDSAVAFLPTVRLERYREVLKEYNANPDQFSEYNGQRLSLSTVVALMGEQKCYERNPSGTPPFVATKKLKDILPVPETGAKPDLNQLLVDSLTPGYHREFAVATEQSIVSIEGKPVIEGTPFVSDSGKVRVTRVGRVLAINVLAAIAPETLNIVVKANSTDRGLLYTRIIAVGPSERDGKPSVDDIAQQRMPPGYERTFVLDAADTPIKVEQVGKPGGYTINEGLTIPGDGGASFERKGRLLTVKVQPAAPRDEFTISVNDGKPEQRTVRMLVGEAPDLLTRNGIMGEPSMYISDPRELYVFEDDPMKRLSLTEMYRGYPGTREFEPATNSQLIGHKQFVHAVNGISRAPWGISAWDEGPTCVRHGGLYRDAGKRQHEIAITRTAAEFARRDVEKKPVVLSRDEDLAAKAFDATPKNARPLVRSSLWWRTYTDPEGRYGTKEITIDQGQQFAAQAIKHALTLQDLPQNPPNVYDPIRDALRAGKIRSVEVIGKPYQEAMYRPKKKLMERTDRETGRKTQYWSDDYNPGGETHYVMHFATHVKLTFEDGRTIEQGALFRGPTKAEADGGKGYEMIPGATLGSESPRDTEGDIRTRLTENSIELMDGVEAKNRPDFRRRDDLSALLYRDGQRRQFDKPLYLSAPPSMDTSAGTPAYDLCEKLTVPPSGSSGMRWEKEPYVFIELKERTRTDERGEVKEIVAVATYVQPNGEELEGEANVIRKSAVARLEPGSTTWAVEEGAAFTHIHTQQNRGDSYHLKDVPSLMQFCNNNPRQLFNTVQSDESARRAVPADAAVEALMFTGEFDTEADIPRDVFHFVESQQVYLMIRHDGSKVVYSPSQHADTSPRYQLRLRCVLNGRTTFIAPDSREQMSFPQPVTADGMSIQQKEDLAKQKAELTRRYPGIIIGETFVCNPRQDELDTFDIVDNANSRRVSVSNLTAFMARHDLQQAEREQALDLLASEVGTPADTLELFLRRFSYEALPGREKDCKDDLIAKLLPLYDEAVDKRAFLRTLAREILASNGLIMAEKVDTLVQTMRGASRDIRWQTGSESRSVPLANGYSLRIEMHSDTVDISVACGAKIGSAVLTRVTERETEDVRPVSVEGGVSKYSIEDLRKAGNYFLSPKTEGGETLIGRIPFTHAIEIGTDLKAGELTPVGPGEFHAIGKNGLMDKRIIVREGPRPSPAGRRTPNGTKYGPSVMLTSESGGQTLERYVLDEMSALQRSDAPIRRMRSLASKSSDAWQRSRRTEDNFDQPVPPWPGNVPQIEGAYTALNLLTAAQLDIREARRLSNENWEEYAEAAAVKLRKVSNRLKDGIGTKPQNEGDAEMAIHLAAALRFVEKEPGRNGQRRELLETRSAKEYLVMPAVALPESHPDFQRPVRRLFDLYPCRGSFAIREQCIEAALGMYAAAPDAKARSKVLDTIMDELEMLADSDHMANPEQSIERQSSSSLDGVALDILAAKLSGSQSLYAINRQDISSGSHREFSLYSADARIRVRWKGLTTNEYVGTSDFERECAELAPGSSVQLADGKVTLTRRDKTLVIDTTDEATLGRLQISIGAKNQKNEDLGLMLDTTIRPVTVDGWRRISVQKLAEQPLSPGFRGSFYVGVAEQLRVDGKDIKNNEEVKLANGVTFKRVSDVLTVSVAADAKSGLFKLETLEGQPADGATWTAVNLCVPDTSALARYREVTGEARRERLRVLGLSRLRSSADAMYELVPNSLPAAEQLLDDPEVRMADYNVRYAQGHFLVRNTVEAGWQQNMVFDRSRLPGTYPPRGGVNIGIMRSESDRTPEWVTLESLADLRVADSRTEPPESLTRKSLLREALLSPPPLGSPQTQRRYLLDILDLCSEEMYDRGADRVNSKQMLYETISKLCFNSDSSRRIVDMRAFMTDLLDQLMDPSVNGVLSKQNVERISRYLQREDRLEKYVPLLRPTQGQPERVLMEDGYTLAITLEQNAGRTAWRVALAKPGMTAFTAGEQITITTADGSSIGAVDPPSPTQRLLSGNYLTDTGLTVTVRGPNGKVLLNAMPVRIAGTEFSRTIALERRLREVTLRADVDAVKAEVAKDAPDQNVLRQRVEAINGYLPEVKFEPNNGFDKFGFTELKFKNGQGFVEFKPGVPGLPARPGVSAQQAQPPRIEVTTAASALESTDAAWHAVELGGGTIADLKTRVQAVNDQLNIAKRAGARFAGPRGSEPIIPDGKFSTTVASHPGYRLLFDVRLQAATLAYAPFVLGQAPNVETDRRIIAACRDGNRNKWAKDATGADNRQYYCNDDVDGRHMGIYRYDGSKFEKLSPDRLWVAMPEDEETVFKVRPS